MSALHSFNGVPAAGIRYIFVLVLALRAIAFLQLGGGERSAHTFSSSSSYRWVHWSWALYAQPKCSQHVSFVFLPLFLFALHAISHSSRLFLHLFYDQHGREREGREREEYWSFKGNNNNNAGVIYLFCFGNLGFSTFCFLSVLEGGVINTWDATRRGCDAIEDQEQRKQFGDRETVMVV